jgi:cytoskeleton protein RodZ
MSEEQLPVQFSDTGQAALDASKSAGQMLREAREAHGLHVAALAVSLKVPVKKLEALEADQHHELPDAVFVRALASSVCRALKVDAAPILAKLPQLNTRVLEQSANTVNVAFRTRADGPAPSALANLNRPAVFGVLALLLAAIVLMLLPDFSARSSAPAVATGTAATGSAASNGETMGSPMNVPTTPAANAASETTGVVTAGAATSGVASSTPAVDTGTFPKLSASPSLSTPSVSSPTLTISPLGSAGSGSAADVPANSAVVFRVTGETWVEVKDADGKIIFQRILQSGQTAGVAPESGKLPWRVIVGRANLTEVSVRGQPFDLLPVSSKDAVARFQVK